MIRKKQKRRKKENNDKIRFQLTLDGVKRQVLHNVYYTTEKEGGFDMAAINTSRE